MSLPCPHCGQATRNCTRCGRVMYDWTGSLTHDAKLCPKCREEYEEFMKQTLEEYKEMLHRFANNIEIKERR